LNISYVKNKWKEKMDKLIKEWESDKTEIKVIK